MALFNWNKNDKDDEKKASHEDSGQAADAGQTSAAGQSSEASETPHESEPSSNTSGQQSDQLPDTGHQPAPQPTVDNFGTRNLVVEALEQVGCQYDIDENSGDFIFNYQGEQFIIQASDEYQFIVLRDLWWYDAPLTDLTAVSFIQRAVNLCNISGPAKLMYSIDEQGGRIWVHTQFDTPFIKEMPKIGAFMQTLLSMMLRSHHDFYRRLEQIRQEEYSKNNG